jgi:hypothetical protein
MTIDTTFDFRSDTPEGKDPDSHSPTLRKYHQVLWSRPLPDGSPFELSVDRPGVYLHHESRHGEFFLGSDSIIQSYTNPPRTVVEKVPEAEREEFRRIGYTIGGMLVFPGNQIDRRRTINTARGLHPRVADRFDLTLECIRRHYANATGTNPLADVLGRYDDFLRLYGNFRGYVDYFLLQDLVSADYESVQFFTDFYDFATPAIPPDLDTYVEYRRRSIEFVAARNQRIAALGL